MAVHRAKACPEMGDYDFEPAVKVAHVATISGSLKYLLLNQMCTIQGAGYSVVSISSPGDETTDIESAGILHIPVPITRRLTPVADLVSLWRLYQIIRRERFTIVHTHNPKPGLLGQLAAKIAGLPVIVNTIHGFYFHDYMHPVWREFYIFLEKIAARCSDAILFQNKEDMHTAIQRKICTVDQAMYLGNGIDLIQFDPQRFSDGDITKCRSELDIPVGAPVVGFVGRLAAKRKGFLDFLHAGVHIAEHFPNVRFLIIGEADIGKPDAVEPSRATDLGLTEQCLFLGHRPNEELPMLYKTMDVLVLPSLFEGVPRVVMEASAMGVPAIVTDVKGNREAVEHKRNGLLVPLGDVEALANAIIELLTDKEKSRRMGEEGRRMALERFDEQLVFEKVKAEYARLLRRKGSQFQNP